MFDPFESFALMRALFCLLFLQDVIPFPRRMLSPASVTATSWCELVVCSVLTSYSCIFSMLSLLPPGLFNHIPFTLSTISTSFFFVFVPRSFGVT